MQIENNLKQNDVKHPKIEFFDNSHIIHYYLIGFEEGKGWSQNLSFKKCKI